MLLMRTCPSLLPLLPPSSPSRPLPWPSLPQTTFASMAGRKGNRLTIVKDRIFFASGHEVRGFSKKGKNFYNIETFMSEDILSMVGAVLCAILCCAVL